MKLYQIIDYNHRILKEYNNTLNLTSLSAPGGTKASGKNFDNMAVGASQPYAPKQNNSNNDKIAGTDKKRSEKTINQYEQIYPNLGSIAQKVKDSPIKGDIVVTGNALRELEKLIQTFNPQLSDNNEMILPFSENIVLKVKGDKFFIGYSEESQKNQ